MAYQTLRDLDFITFLTSSPPTFSFTYSLQAHGPLNVSLTL